MICRVCYFTSDDKREIVVGLVQVALDPTIGLARAELEAVVERFLASFDPTDLSSVSRVFLFELQLRQSDRPPDHHL